MTNSAVNVLFSKFGNNRHTIRCRDIFDVRSIVIDVNDIIRIVLGVLINKQLGIAE